MQQPNEKIGQKMAYTDATYSYSADFEKDPDNEALYHLVRDTGM